MEHLTITVDNLTTDAQVTAQSIWVDVAVPEYFELECEKCYPVLNDALRPWGGTAAAYDLYRENDNLVVARFMRH